MSNKGVIDTDFDPEELVREALNPSFALPVTAFQREVLAIRERLGPRLLQELSSLLNDGVDAVTAILAVKQQDLRQFKRKEARIRQKAKNKVARIRREAEAKEAQIREEAYAAQHKGGTTMHEKGQIAGSAVRAAYPAALTEVRQARGGKPFQGDHGKAVKALVEKFGRGESTVRRDLKGLGPRSNKASE